jgi:hypothetical protein
LKALRRYINKVDKRSQPPIEDIIISVPLDGSSACRNPGKRMKINSENKWEGIDINNI